MLRTPSRDSTVVVSLAGITICKIYLADSRLVKQAKKEAVEIRIFQRPAKAQS
jgi:hypothetical protein